MLEGVGGVYRVRLDAGGTADCVLRGRLKQDGSSGGRRGRGEPPTPPVDRRQPRRLVAGDRVRIAPPGDPDAPRTIEEVEERGTELVRASMGGRTRKVVAANVDRVAVVVAAARPELRPELVDRFLVLVETSGLDPLVLVNKVDLAPDGEALCRLEERLAAADVPVLGVSALSGEGMDALSRILFDGITALAGPSGVGKSTLLNAVQPGLALRTGDVSRRQGRGRHTTVSARLLELDGGGWVVDTPGFSDVGLEGVDLAELPHAWPEFRVRAHDCRFRNCTHLHEPGCAVMEAVQAGEIPRERWTSYRDLHGEISEAHS
ncbi:MAG: ribosome small subunit-dependent GTPase A [Gemmatimonadales bacterium]|nr:MAG: ribosome small subunit-dependent GTPase A [Gemmatimonadales bacterium]